MEKESKRINRLYLTISGVILSIIFIILGFHINSVLGRIETPLIGNELSKYFILMFLALTSGYNIAMSIKNIEKAYYFYAGLFVPILMLVLFNSFITSEFLLLIFMVLCLSFPIIYTKSGILAEHDKFKKFINWFSKFIPNTLLFTFALGDYAFPLLNVYINFNIGVFGYIISLIISIFIMFFLSKKSGS